MTENDNLLSDGKPVFDFHVEFKISIKATDYETARKLANTCILFPLKTRRRSHEAETLAVYAERITPIETTLQEKGGGQ